MDDGIPLAPKHHGMRVDASGVLGRIRDGDGNPGLYYMAGELLKHLEETARRFYAGELTVVDEFFQLYCLDDRRPEGTHHAG